jgi:hypothetical protein
LTKELTSIKSQVSNLQKFEQADLTFLRTYAEFLKSLQIDPETAGQLVSRIQNLNQTLNSIPSSDSNESKLVGSDKIWYMTVSGNNENIGQILYSSYQVCD